MWFGGSAVKIFIIHDKMIILHGERGLPDNALSSKPFNILFKCAIKTFWGSLDYSINLTTGENNI